MAVLVTFIYLSHADANTTKVTQCLKYSKNEVTLKKALGGTMQMQGFLKKTDETTCLSFTL